MKLTKIRYKKLEELMPIARKPAVSNYEFMSAVIYIIENGYKWRKLTKKYGKWYTVYMKFSRLSKNVTIAKSYGFFSLKPYFSSHEKAKTV